MSERREIAIVAAEATALYLIANPITTYRWARRRGADVKPVRHYRSGGSIVVGLTIDGLHVKIPKGQLFLNTASTGKKAMIHADTPKAHVERLTVMNCVFGNDLDVESFTPQWGGAS